MGAKLKTVGDLMITGSKIPFVNENIKMEKALKIISQKKLGRLVVRNTKGKTSGIITDGQIRRAGQKNKNIQTLLVKNVMTKNPISVDKDTLASKSLSIMSEKKITSLCVHKNKKNNKTIGLLHIHHIISANIH